MRYWQPTPVTPKLGIKKQEDNSQFKGSWIFIKNLVSHTHREILSQELVPTCHPQNKTSFLPRFLEPTFFLRWDWQTHHNKEKRPKENAQYKNEPIVAKKSPREDGEKKLWLLGCQPFLNLSLHSVLSSLSISMPNSVRRSWASSLVCHFPSIPHSQN